MDVAFNLENSSQHLINPSQYTRLQHLARIPISRYTSAFTLLELVVTLAVSSVLLTLASPHLINLVNNNQYSVAINKIAYDLAYARSEAIKRAQDVLLCKSSDGQFCTPNSQWQDGWIVYVEQSEHDKQRSPDEPLLKVQQALGKPIRISFTSFNRKNNIVYRPSGASDYSNGTFRFCTLDTTYHKNLILSRTGRTYIKVNAGPIFNKNSSC